MAEGVFKLAIDYKAGGVDCRNTLHYYIADTALLDDPGMQTFLNALDTQLTAPFRAMLADNGTLVAYTLYETTITQHPAPPIKTAHKTKNLVGLRTSATDHLNRGVCGVVSLQTNRAGRSARGHMFCPPVQDTAAVIATNIGELVTTDAYWTAMVNWATALEGTIGGHAFWAPLSGFNGKLVVYSQTLRDRAAPNWWFDVQTVTPRVRYRWLRSRES